ncbi:MAG TPA: hypothetical protein VLO13_00330 [Halomonas sp.]|nr:hypothetical protein [Halomonas sp.]
MGRPSNWNSPTDSVRLPKHAIAACLALARQLDDPKPVEHVKNNVQNPTAQTQPLQMLTSESHTGTYRLFLAPPRELPPWIDAEVDRCCDQLFAGLDETERAYLLSRLIEKMGEKVDV